MESDTSGTELVRATYLSSVKWTIVRKTSLFGNCLPNVSYSGTRRSNGDESWPLTPIVCRFSTDLSPPFDWHISSANQRPRKHASLDRPAGCRSTIIVWRKHVTVQFSIITVKHFGASQLEQWVVDFARISGRNYLFPGGSSTAREKCLETIHCALKRTAWQLIISSTLPPLDVILLSLLVAAGDKK